MNFKEKIKAHQQGEYDFATELVELAQSDMVKTKMICTQVEQDFYNEEDGHYTLTFNRWRPEYIVKRNTPEYRMARNIKVWIARYTKKANDVRKKDQFEGTQLEIAEYDVLDTIYRTLAAVGNEFYKDDFDKIPENVYKAIEEKYGWNYYLSFREEIGEFQAILPQIKRKKRQLAEQYVPLIIESLNEVLPKVSLDRTEDEIIGFIAISTKRRVDRKVTKVLGSKVHNINGERYYFSKEEIRGKGFKHTKAESVLMVEERVLNRNQSSFYYSLRSKIQQEIDSYNIEPFTFDSEGNVIGFNKRYFAEKMNMGESAFKKRLKRIQDKSNKTIHATTE